MARDTSRIGVVDLEATCWENDETYPERKKGEIIEIGVAVLDTKTLRVVGAAGILVKPTTTEVSEFCTRLTTITPEMVADRPMLKEALGDVAPLINFGMTWASWGDYDRRQMERQCRDEGIKYPFGPTHLNLKNLFALFAGEKECGLEQALPRLGLLMEGTHHRGVDDANNAARLLARMLYLMRRPE